MKYDKLLEKMYDLEYKQFKKPEYVSKMWKTSSIKMASISKYAVEDFENYSIIIDSDSALTHRNTGNNGIEIINQTTYHKLTNPVIKRRYNNNCNG